jgi:uncharacterized LabA/DUF88 family protein
MYIDGFNLYHAIDEIGNPKLKWINLWQLSASYLREGEILTKVSFFTAILRWNQEKQQRHQNFIAACKAVGVNVVESTFKKNKRYCRQFDRRCRFDEEKQTDVSLALSVISDAYEDEYDRAILLTADSDQVPTARFLQSRFPHKRLTLVAPPNRLSQARELGDIIEDRGELHPGRMLTCCLPRDVCDSSGKRVATMPALYREGEGRG